MKNDFGRQNDTIEKMTHTNEWTIVREPKIPIKMDHSCHTEIAPAVRAAVKTGFETSYLNETSLWTK